MRKSRIYLIHILSLLLLSTLSIRAQDSLLSHQSVRFEIGLGGGSVGEGGGLSGRLALSYLHLNWGGIIRLSAHDGGTGKGSGWFGPPKEEFFDEGILLSYIPIQGNSWQMIASAGIGFLYGRRLTSTKYDMEDFGRVMGLAYEFEAASAGSTFGWSLSIMGNINSISNLFAVVLSLTLGYQK